MAANTNASSTGVDTQAELRKRNVAAPSNGGYLPKELEDKLDKKTKQQVRKLVFQLGFGGVVAGTDRLNVLREKTKLAS